MMSTQEDRVRFGARLRQQREARSLSVPDIVKLTKIPEKSLHNLEGGAFEELPAEVFVRGFLKSYCRAVGLEVETMLRDYDGLVRDKRPRGLPSLARLGTTRGDSGPVTAIHGAPPAPTAAAPVAAPVADAPPEKTAAEKDKEELSLYARLGDIGKGPGRIGLTVAVIILVIVATVTMSLLLRRPGRGVGDGVSASPTTAAKIA
jgi:Helix-turn-helix domain